MDTQIEREGVVMNVNDCKRMILRVGNSIGVDPTRISMKLLSKEDKDDMIGGLVSEEELSIHVSVWKNSLINAESHGRAYKFPVITRDWKSEPLNPPFVRY